MTLLLRQSRITLMFVKVKLLNRNSLFTKGKGEYNNKPLEIVHYNFVSKERTFKTGGTIRIISNRHSLGMLHTYKF